MPGRLVMDQQGAPYAGDVKKEPSHADMGVDSFSEGAAGTHSALPAATINGFDEHVQDGKPLNGSMDEPAMNGKHNEASEIFWKLGNAPALDQSWRTSDANKPLGKLIARLAQQCYADLHQTLEEMNNLGAVESTTQHPTAGNAQDQSEVSLAKKQKLLEFASEQRDRFIKTLILSSWSRDEEDIAKLIDLKVWLDQQRNAHVHTAQDIGQIKIDSIPMKTPNPNIDHALELLATGKASWIPDLGYLQIDKLTARQLLQTLRNMNVALATRLNLHDELPSHMQKFSVADGRATFIVPGEFEVDLAVADEDPSSPFFFIDIRFLFSPSTNDLRDQLRGPVEFQINAVLANKGLGGCYDLLHNFVLTAKIRTLLVQAEKLKNGKWFDCIRIENHRRIITIQYWTNVPGPKSWLEFGVASGVVPGKRYRKPPTPCISVKWIRAGTEVAVNNIAFDWVQLDVEKCLLSVIAEHTTHIVQTTKSRLHTLVPAVSVLETEVQDRREPTDTSRLVVNLPGLRAPLNLSIESITGKYAITPTSLQALNTASYLNSNTSADLAAVVVSLTCATLRAQFDKLAVPLDWLPAREVDFNNQMLAALLKVDVRKYRAVRCNQNWDREWILLVSFGLDGISWWVVNLGAKSIGAESGRPVVLKPCLRLPTSDSHGKALLLSRASLLQIEKQAAAHIFNTVLGQSLIENKIPHASEKLLLTASSRRTQSRSTATMPPMFMRLSAIMHDKQKKTARPWAVDIIRVSYQGLDLRGHADGTLSTMHFDVRISLLPGKMKYLQKHLSRKPKPDVAISATGGLALRMSVPFGQSALPKIRAQLQRIEALDTYVASLVQRRFTCLTVTLAKLAFQYSSSPLLRAEILFGKDRSAILKLEPRDSNPHFRIRGMLEKGLNDRAEGAFRMFTSILLLSLPLLQTIDKLLVSDVNAPALTVHVRSSTWYSLKYQSPLQACAFSIRARIRSQRDKKIVRWHVQGAQNGSSSTSVSQDLSNALKELWQRTDDHTLGLDNGLVTDASGVGLILEDLDAIMHRFPAAQEPEFITID